MTMVLVALVALLPMAVATVSLLVIGGAGPETRVRSRIRL